MKSITLASTMVVLSVALAGCGTVGSMKAGSDTAYMNATRGSDGALVNKAQAENYALQQELTAREIELENMKRRQTTDAVRDTASAAHSAVSAARSVFGLFN